MTDWLLKHASNEIKLRLKYFFRNYVRRKKLNIAIYGSPNAGKTTLANLILKDLINQKMGKVSKIPHETRKIQKIENVKMKTKYGNLFFNLIDTPGLSAEVKARKFYKYGIRGKKAKNRSKEAMEGIIESMAKLKEMDNIIIVMDSTKTPLADLNLALITNLEVQKIPFVIVANKIDLKKSNVDLIKSVFPEQKILLLLILFLSKKTRLMKQL